MLRTWLVLLALVAPVVTAGPLDDAGHALRACDARVAPAPPCNHWASRPPTGGANEVHVAVNPLNDAHWLAVAKDYGLGASTDCGPGGAFHVASAFYVTFDAGKTWDVGRVPAPYSNGGAEPSPLAYRCGSDPVAMFGPDGTAYYVLLNFQYTGGRQAAIAVARSPDGGLTWPARDIRIFGTSPGADKEWGTVTRDGRVHVVWTDVYSGGINYARTVTGYDDWQVRRLWSAGSGNPAVSVAGGPASEVVVTWRDSSNLRFTTSTDGGETFAPVQVAFRMSPFEQSFAPRLPLMPQLAVDADPGSPFAGSVYVTWPDTRDGSAAAYLAFSRDGGASWSTPARVSDGSNPRREVMPTVAVAPGGRVDVAWLDQRHAPAQRVWETFVASSLDGGVTFTGDRLVQETPLVEQWSRHQNGDVFIGDYIGVAATADATIAAFPGNGAERALTFRDLARADAYVAASPAPLGAVAAGSTPAVTTLASPAAPTWLEGLEPSE